MTKKESDEGRNWGESNAEDKNRSGPAQGAHGIIGEARANTPFPFLRPQHTIWPEFVILTPSVSSIPDESVANLSEF